MRAGFRIILLLAAAALAGNAQAGRLLTDVAEPVSERYIVVLEDQAETEPADGPLRQLAQTLSDVYGLVLVHVYGHALRGFAAQMSDDAAALLAADPRIAYVEQDQRVRTVATTQNGAIWGLDRVDETDLPLDSRYIYDTAGQGAHVYVIDTGINHDHQEFAGRIGEGVNTASDGGLLGSLLGLLLGGNRGEPTADCNGHGTHVSGTAVGTTYGVAKQATVHPVRVLGCAGSGLNSAVIAGVDWVTENHVSPAVANMSLGGGASEALDQAVRNSVAAGVTYVVAAGNEDADACGGSPARLGQAITIGASNREDVRASFSNWGECVDLFAPGADITSAWHTGESSTNALDGTSMASPHVAGAAALMLGAQPGLAPDAVMQTLRDRATADRLQQTGAGSPNLLLYTRTQAGIEH